MGHRRAAPYAHLATACASFLQPAACSDFVISFLRNLLPAAARVSFLCHLLLSATLFLLFATYCSQQPRFFSLQPTALSNLVSFLCNLLLSAALFFSLQPAACSSLVPFLCNLLISAALTFSLQPAALSSLVLFFTSCCFQQPRSFLCNLLLSAALFFSLPLAALSSLVLFFATCWLQQPRFFLWLLGPPRDAFSLEVPFCQIGMLPV
eukprot:TRINITY_DN19459_c0_g1_i1.p1 TRINITY_DN19459_c0_g1~~TRINITY_DN19459_c0_g1_i1.p1  ORF type:complete len:208 (+),score=57.22 TRINITY_DN19459_c0_g1_i1:705-1328(+)